jgi:transcriptional regulator with XRE-family HTH domain
MTIVEITGGMLRAARSLAGLSQQELAERANLPTLSHGLGRLERQRHRHTKPRT